MIKYVTNEMDIMYKIKHPNIVKLHDHFEDYEFLYLQMEFCRGGKPQIRLALQKTKEV